MVSSSGADFVTSSSSHVRVVGVEITTVTVWVSSGGSAKLGVAVFDGMGARERLEEVTVS